MGIPNLNTYHNYVYLILITIIITHLSQILLKCVIKHTSWVRSGILADPSIHQKVVVTWLFAEHEIFM